MAKSKGKKIVDRLKNFAETLEPMNTKKRDTNSDTFIAACRDHCGNSIANTGVGKWLGQALEIIAERDATIAELRAVKIAPVQGFSAGIPWEMHLRAYDAYCKKHGEQDALIDLDGRNCRGGFHDSELDDFIPGWRDELTTIAAHEATIAELRDKAELLDRVTQYGGDMAGFLTECLKIRTEALAGGDA